MKTSVLVGAIALLLGGALPALASPPAVPASHPSKVDIVSPALSDLKDVDDGDDAPAPALAPDDGSPDSGGDSTSGAGLQNDARERAMNTVTPAIAPTAAEKRVIGVTYLDACLTLLDLAQTHLRDASISPSLGAVGLAELEAASGKATTAALELFHDPVAAARARGLALKLGEIETLARTNPLEAAALIDRTRPQLAAVYQSELATMGGGAGGVPPEQR